jgi:hypothetical protein
MKKRIGPETITRHTCPGCACFTVDEYVAMGETCESSRCTHCLIGSRDIPDFSVTPSWCPVLLSSDTV